MNLQSVEDGNNKVDATIDAWLSHISELPKSVAQNLVFVTDLFYAEENGEAFFNHSYFRVFNGGIGSEAVRTRFERLLEEGNSKYSMRSDEGVLTASPSYADLSHPVTDENYRDVDEVVAETRLKLEETVVRYEGGRYTVIDQDIIDQEEKVKQFSNPFLERYISGRSDLEDLSVNEEFRIEEVLEGQ